MKINRFFNKITVVTKILKVGFMEMLCPCHSHKRYIDCCKKCHDGIIPKHAVDLMRSRYSAYALKLVNYIVETTHHLSPERGHDLNEWKKDILEFCQNTSFHDLNILENEEKEKQAFVTFKASLSNQGRDISFIEKSQFLKDSGRWLYLKAM
jgi:SEC-C motif domain protein